MLKLSSFAGLYRLLRPEVGPQRGKLALVVVLSAVVAFAEKAPLALIDPLFRRVLFPQTDLEEGWFVLEWFRGLFDRAMFAVSDVFYGDTAPDSIERKLAALWTIAILILLLTLLNAIAQYMVTLTARRAALRMVVELRQRLARHVVGLSMRFHGGRQFGDMLSRMSSDVSQTLNSVVMVLRDLVQQPLQLIGALAVAGVMAPLPTATILVLMPLVAIPIATLGKRVRRRTTKSLASLGASMEVLTQIFTGIRTVKAFRAEERELARYRAVSENFLETSMKTVRAVATIEASTTLLSHLGFAVVLVVAGWATLKLGLFTSYADMAGFFAGVGMIYTHVKKITNAVNHVQESSGAADRLQAMLDERPDIVERENALAVTSLGRGIDFEAVSFSYPGAERPALDALNLHISPGETLALVGASGAGKTTLIDLLARFVDVGAGRVAIDGRDLRELRLDDWTAMYAMVGQSPFLFHATVRENIAYGKPGSTQAEIESAARAAFIHDYIAGLPQGYDTVVGDQGARLSGGQRQRITIARAILKGAPLLLLDEATSALDSESEQEVQRALDELMHGRTVIVIAHRLSTIRTADRIAVLERGRLVELGSHDELLRRGGVYARLHAAQFGAASASVN
jgi:subfamily B ATP-binding cassette protein MsbA